MCNCDNDNQSGDSGFIMGLVIGAVIAAVVAIYVYKHQRSEVFVKLKSKLEEYFSRFTTDATPAKSKSKPAHISGPAETSKISVVLPKKVIESVKPAKQIVSKPKKMFVTAKK